MRRGWSSVNQHDPDEGVWGVNTPLEEVGVLAPGVGPGGSTTNLRPLLLRAPGSLGSYSTPGAGGGSGTSGLTLASQASSTRPLVDRLETVEAVRDWMTPSSFEAVPQHATDHYDGGKEKANGIAKDKGKGKARQIAEIEIGEAEDDDDDPDGVVVHHDERLGERERDENERQGSGASREGGKAPKRPALIDYPSEPFLPIAARFQRHYDGPF